MSKKPKLMILSTYPAPYRMQLFREFRNEFEVDIFFETAEGDERNKDWFFSEGAHILECEEDKRKYNRACRNLKQYKLVALYEYSTKRACILMLLCRIFKIPYVINCDGVNLLTRESGFKNLIKTFFISAASGCFASGINAEQYFTKYGATKEKIHQHTFTTLTKEDILSAPIPTEEKSQLRKELHLPHNVKIAIAVGRFIPLKRYDELIRCWKNMDKDEVLLIIGGGPELSKYQQTINELGLDNVILEPFHKKEELYRYYKASDVFVHPTSYDVWGLVVNEAMACGLPVIVSDHCVAGLELIEHGVNGYLASMGDEEQLCHYVRRVFNNTALADTMAQRVIDKITDYTIENMASTHIEVCKEIIENSVQ